MTREELKNKTIIILNREDITIEEMTENIMQLVDIAMYNELRLYGVVRPNLTGNHSIKEVKEAMQIDSELPKKQFYCLDEVHRGKEDVCQRQCEYCKKNH
jgi:hypothetical protein